MSLLKRFCAYYKPHKLILFLDMTAAFLVAAIGMGYPIITRYMLNDWIPNKNYSLVIIGGLSLLGVYIVRMGLRYFIQYYGHIMGAKMQAQMRSDMFIKLQKLPYTYFDEHETGKIMSRMTNDLFDISELAHHGPENLFIAGFTLIGTFIYLMTINWILGLIVFVMVPIVFGITFYFRSRWRKAYMESRVAIANINASIESSVSGIRVTKAFTNEKKEEEKFEISNQEYVRTRKNILGAMAAFFSTSQFVTDVFNVLVLIAGGLFLYDGTISFGDYSTFIVSINLFIAPINQLINFMEQFQSGSTGFKRFIEIIDEKEETEHQGTIVCQGFEGDIIFDHVSFKYNSSKREVLNDVSFNIKKGETVALVGPSGGGKTTICHLIPHFYIADSGTISIDGTPINDFTLQSLRSHIGIVQQDVFMFGGTIKDNIKYGNEEATDQEIVEAARRANILDYINSLPDKWETQVGERGVRLSGGQKQRLSIARVFLKNPAILILDEATSALDNTTELLIQQALDELCKGRTTIVVAHRLSTIKNADKIIVISNGKIEEQGSHDELIAKDGVYKVLYELQFRSDDERKLDTISMLS